jgi:hypothetical protein
MKGIKDQHPLLACSSSPGPRGGGQVLISSEEMLGDVDKAMNFVKTYVNSLDSYAPTSRNISVADAHGGHGRGGGRGGGHGCGHGRGGKGGHGGGGGHGKDKIKYLTSKEWNKLLCAEEQAAIQAAQDSAGIGNKKRKIKVLETAAAAGAAAGTAAGVGGAGAGACGAAGGAAPAGGVDTLFDTQ